MKKALLILSCIFFAFIASAQWNTNPNKAWVFGSHAGLDFTSGSPVGFSSVSSTGEGCASVGSSTGALLFYTDGKNVWDRTNTLMPHGTSIVSFFTPSSTQAALIVPVIGNPNQYYVFSLEQYSGTPGFSHLAYSIVDMTLNSGYGDVISASAGTPLASGLAEKITAVQGNSCNIWVLTHNDDGPTFYAYNITASGISATPVTSTAGTFSAPHVYSIGVIKVSPDRHKLVSQTWPTGGAEGTELFDFDATTGIVSNCRVLNTSHPEYGAEFSPDGTKLYAEAYSGEIGQYDVTLPTAAAIIASYTIVVPGATYSDLKLAPDGKIYFRGSSASVLSCFSTPNGAGLGCGYVAAAATLAAGTSCQLGLPNNVITVLGGGDTTYQHHDTTTCILPSSSITITAHDTGSATGYMWYDGVTTTETTHVSASGNYWVMINYGCSMIIDTIKVHAHFDTVLTHQDTSACVNDDHTRIQLTAPPGTSYLWYDGDTTVMNQILGSGDYWVRFVNGCVLTVDTFHALINYNPPAIVGPDTVCPSHNFIFTDPLPGGHWHSTAPAVAKIDATTGVLWALVEGSTVLSYTMATGCYSSKPVTISDFACRTAVKPVTPGAGELPSVYPNPVSGLLIISADPSLYSSFSITNTIGQVVQKESITSSLLNVNTRSLVPGIYYIIFSGDQARVVQKLVKE